MERGSITSRKESRLVDRRTVLKLLGVAGAASVGAAPAVATDSDSSPEFDPVEATASEIRSRYVTGDETAQSEIGRAHV